MIVAYPLIVFRSAKMVLIRTITLKLILTTCLASSLEVVHIDVKDYGSPTSRVWLTEKQTFYFFIESDVELVGGIECKCPMGREIKGELEHYDKSSSNNNYYFSSDFTVSQYMDGEWTCYVYYKKFLLYYYIKIIIDVGVDVDECSASHGSWPCSYDANCINTHGSYKCTCLTGYTGNGTYCQDVNECISGHSSWPCSPDENCTNTLGSYECIPLTGYTGNGQGQDVDGCNMSSSPSSAKANCNNTLGSDEFPSLTGYTVSGVIRTLILVVIIVVVLIVVAAVVWLIVGLYKIRQRREKAIQSEFNYEFFENTTERPMPHPAQWDNYSVPVNRQNENDTDIVPFQERNVEEMYAKPQPKSLRKLLDEIVYAKLSFTTVEQIGETPTYGNLSNQTAESNNHIQPKKLIRNPDTPKILPTESPYSEVLPKSMRPNNESSNYVNIIDIQRYVNSDNGEANRDRSEYAEPAYCEIGLKK